MKYKSYLAVVATMSFLLATLNSYAQIDAQHSTYMFSKQLINPASLGETEMANAYGSLRQQWQDLGSTTMATYVDVPLKGRKREHGAGFSLVNDQEGMFNSVSVNFAYSHKQTVWDGTLSIGTQASFLQASWNPEGEAIFYPSTDYHDHYKTTTDFGSESSGIKFDMSLGAHYTRKGQYYGISLTHLNTPELDLDVTDGSTYLYYNRTLHLYGGFDYVLRAIPIITLKPSLYLKTDGKIAQIDLNCNAWYKDRIYAGMSYRYQDAVVFMGGFKQKNGILIGGSYDITTSKVRHTDFGSFDVFFIYEFSLSVAQKTNKYKSIRIL